MTTPPTPRRLWALFEPLHAVSYFHPASRQALSQPGSSQPGSSGRVSMAICD
jgi:hypothetical protein